MSNEYVKILDGKPAGVNQFIGATRQYPLELYKNGMDNHWRPSETNMSDDVKTWKLYADEDEKLVIKRALGFFSAGESEVNNNIFLSEYRYITDGACRQYLIRKAMEEALHNETVAVCCEAFSLKESEVAEAYLNVPSIKNKSDFLLKNTTDIVENGVDIGTIEGKRKFVKNIVCFYIICEGTFFWSSFVMLLAICKKKKFTGLETQIKYTMRDETNHLNFGIYLINEIRKDYPEVFSESFQQEVEQLLKEAVALEIQYAKDTLPKPMLGINSDMFIDFMKFIGNQRLVAVGLNYRFDNNRNPFPWLMESVDVKKMDNFFETKATDYQSAGALVDDL